MAVDFFERNSHAESDPMAELIRKGGFDKAARQIDRHKHINDAGEHENVGGSFLEFMDLCDEAYVIEAMRIAEAITLVMNQVSQSAIDTYLRMKRS